MYTGKGKLSISRRTSNVRSDVTHIYIACESVEPTRAVEAGDPGAVIVRGVYGQQPAALCAANRLAAWGAHLAFHALRVDMTSGGKIPEIGARLETREDGDEWVAIPREQYK